MTYERIYDEYNNLLHMMIEKKGLDVQSFEVQKVARIVSALGKQVNKDVWVDEYDNLLVCPNCKHHFHRTTRQKYCDECGQRLYWNKAR